MDKKGAEPFTKCPGICLLGGSITFLNNVKKMQYCHGMASLTLMSYDDHHQHHHITLTLYHFFIFDYDNDISSDCVASNPYILISLMKCDDRIPIKGGRFTGFGIMP